LRGGVEAREEMMRSSEFWYSERRNTPKHCCGFWRVLACGCLINSAPYRERSDDLLGRVAPSDELRAARLACIAFSAGRELQGLDVAHAGHSHLRAGDDEGLAGPVGAGNPEAGVV